MANGFKTKAVSSLLVVSSVVLSGCDDSSVVIPQDNSDSVSTNYVEEFPYLAKYADMDENDFVTYARLGVSSKGTPITPENIKSIVVGSSINTAFSTFNTRPIFDLGALGEDSLVDVNRTRSVDKTELTSVTNKSAMSDSSQLTVEASVSGSYGGAKASVAANYANAFKKTEADGTVGVKMIYSNTGTLIEILTPGFSGYGDLTEYLLGEELTEDKLKNYVSYSLQDEPSCVSGRYINSVKVNDNLDAKNPYGKIQILREMEVVFDLLKTQHTECSQVDTRDVIHKNLVKLRADIIKSVAGFYTYNGDSFVSKVKLMNAAVGMGELKFGVKDGNAENRWGVAISASYSVPTASIGASGSIQSYQQNGWKSAYENMDISAISYPAGVVDTGAWVKSLADMVKAGGTPLVPPVGELPKAPGVKLPDAIPKARNLDNPPDSVFTSYDDWKKFVEDKKAKPSQDEELAENAEAEINAEDSDVDTLAVRRVASQSMALLKQDLDDVGVVTNVRNEIDRLNDLRRAEVSAGDGKNLVRVDKMFVYDFESSPYDEVIPYLRPNLFIPGETPSKIEGFKNLSKLAIYTERLGQLSTYLEFLSGISSLSNVSPTMSDNFKKFYLNFYDEAYEIISLHISQGEDIPSVVVEGFINQFVGKVGQGTSSKLYEFIKDQSFYSYLVATLLDPGKGRFWYEAPGGYMPMRSGQGGQPQLVKTLRSVMFLGSNPSVSYIDYNNPNINPLSLYSGTDSPQSPWYPVYIFKLGADPVLVFVQSFGAYHIMYGMDTVVKPYRDSSELTFQGEKSRFQPQDGDYDPFRVAAFRDRIIAPSNSFLSNNMGATSWLYSLYFPGQGVLTEQEASRQRFLLLRPGISSLGYSCDYKVNVIKACVYSVNFDEKPQGSDPYPPYFPFQNVTNLEKTGERLVFRGHGVNPVDLKATFPNDKAFVMLLPLNAETLGEDAFRASFSYASDRKPISVVNHQSLELINKIAALMNP